MVRLAKKREVYKSDIEEILEMWREDYGHPEAKIEWIPRSRKYKVGGFWCIYLGFGLDEANPDADPCEGFSKAGELYIDVETGEILDILIGSVWEWEYEFLD